MLDHLSHALLSILTLLLGLVLGALAWVEGGLGAVMAQAGVPEPLQLVLAIVVAVMFLGAALRLFSGLIRVVLIVVLLAIAVHAATSPHGGRAVTHTGIPA